MPNEKERMEKYMKLALELAQKGEGYVNPNPMVGAVVVKDGKIVGQGYHKYFGGPHAEVYALEEAGEAAKDAEMYVTLEPCSHYGKTPPCVDRVIKAGIKKCIIAAVDPNPLVAGRGVKKMQEHGIEVITEFLVHDAYKQNAVFFKYIQSKEPYVFLKCGITLDGKIATRNNDSKWITNEKARAKVQKLRNKFMGIMVGENTFLNDNPRLTARVKNGVDPYRVAILPNLESILENKDKVIDEYNIINMSRSDKKTIIVTDERIINKKPSLIQKLKNEYNIKFIFFQGKEYKLKDIVLEVGKLKIDSILIEGGASLISGAFAEDLVDEGEIFIAPKILGDKEAVPFIKGFSPATVKEGILLNNVEINTYDNNVSFSFKR